MDIEMMRMHILERMDLSVDASDQEIFRLIQEELADYSRDHVLTLTERQTAEIQLFHSLRRLDILQELMEQEEITEVMVNGPWKIFYEKEGELFSWDRHFASKEKLEQVVQQIAGISNKTINEADPILDTRLPDGSRVNIVLPPAGIDGPYLTIRKFSQVPISLSQLTALESLSEEMKAFLSLSVRSGYNVFVSGGTGSGKTTFLNALTQVIPDQERVVVIEDSAELQLFSISNLVRMETRNMNSNGAKEISIRHLIRTSLRMRPDRIIVGEVRGAEALDLLQALNTGHDGGLSTGHGNSCTDMLHRLETMVLMGMDLPLPAVRGQISAGIDLIVHLGRLRDQSRKVLEICEVDGMKDGEISLRSLYRFQEVDRKGGSIHGFWERVAPLKNREKMQRSGHLRELEELYQTEPAGA